MDSSHANSYHPLPSLDNPQNPEAEIGKDDFKGYSQDNGTWIPYTTATEFCPFYDILIHELEIAEGKYLDVTSVSSTIAYYKSLLNGFSLNSYSFSAKNTYFTLSFTERVRIEGYLNQKLSLREIARRLFRHPSTISREIQLNFSKEVDIKVKIAAYSAEKGQKYHDEQILKRYWEGKLDEATANTIRKYIKSKIKYSPEQLANTVLKNKVCTQSIYNYIHGLKIDNVTMKDLRMKGKYKRNNQSKKQKYTNIPNISKRPAYINDRLEFGHWELDSVVSCRKGSGCLFTFLERKTRFLIAVKSDSCDAASLNKALREKINLYPEGTFKTVTSDKGGEFSGLMDIQGLKGVKVYMTDPHSPWQKGSNENANGLIREYYPKGTDFSKVTQMELRYSCINPLMERPRAILYWKTPREAFQKELEKLKLGQLAA